MSKRSGKDEPDGGGARRREHRAKRVAPAVTLGDRVRHLDAGTGTPFDDLLAVVRHHALACRSLRSLGVDDREDFARDLATDLFTHRHEELRGVDSGLPLDAAVERLVGIEGRRLLRAARRFRDILRDVAEAERRSSRPSTDPDASRRVSALAAEVRRTLTAHEYAILRAVSAGRSHAEVARSLGLSPGAVSAAVHSAVRRLRPTRPD